MKWEGPATTSRAVGIQARTLEELELRGLADEFLPVGKSRRGWRCLRQWQTPLPRRFHQAPEPLQLSPFPIAN